MKPTRTYDTGVKVLALSHVVGIGPRLFEVLVSWFQGLDAVFAADASMLAQIDGMDRTAAERIAGDNSVLAEAAAYHRELADRDIAVVTRFDSAYPTLLFELNDPPPLLYVRGRMPSNDRRSVALVGAENATNPGIQLTVNLGRSFAERRVQVVASLSKGIDAAAHVGVRAGNGDSYCLLDTGIDHIHPSEQMPLAIDIAREGGVISEQAPATEFDAGTIPETNRLIVGLAQAVVVTEVYSDSTRTLDLLTFCRQIGKLTFFMVDPELGPLADTESLNRAIECGALPLVGHSHIDDIIKALV